jgi:hypothetical protein
LLVFVALTVSLVAIIALPPAATAGDGLLRTTFPSGDDPGPPFYARIEPAPPHFLHDGQWAAIVFYRDPGCDEIQAFNLLNFFDFGPAFNCGLTVHGANYWEVEPLSGAPKMAHSLGNGAVPVWFVPLDAVQQAAQDGDLNVGELASLDGLLIGYARQFNEVLHPTQLPPQLGGGGNPNPKMILNAHGWLEDGRTFRLHATEVDEELASIHIEFH